MTDTDLAYLRAAEGRLQLGDNVSAFEELERIEPLNRAHPDVLKLRWRIYGAAMSWANAVEVGLGLARVAPDAFEGWWMTSYALRYVNRTSLREPVSPRSDPTARVLLPSGPAPRSY